MSVSTEMLLTMKGADQTGAAFASVGANSENMMRQLTSMESRMSGLFRQPHINLLHLSRGMVTAFSVGGIIEGIKSATEEFERMADAAGKMSEKMGVNLEQYETWVSVAGNLHISLSKVDDILEKLSKRKFTTGEINKILGIPDGFVQKSDRVNTMENAETAKAGGHLGFFGTIGENAERWKSGFAAMSDMSKRTGIFSADPWAELSRALHGEETFSTMERHKNESKINTAMDTTFSFSELEEQNKKAAEFWKRTNQDADHHREKLMRDTNKTWMEDREWGMPQEEAERLENKKRNEEKLLRAREKLAHAMEESANRLAPWTDAAGYGMVQAMYGHGSRAQGHGGEGGINGLLQRVLYQNERTTHALENLGAI